MPWGDFANAELVAGHSAATVQGLKAAEGNDMVLFAGAGLVQSFSALGLIDEYRILGHPVVHEAGKPLFAGGDRLRIDLVDTRSYPRGSVLLTYRPS